MSDNPHSQHDLQGDALFRRDQTTQAEQTHTSPLPARRGDLLISPQVYLGQTVFVVKDPVALTYFRLQPPEHFVLTQLDGQATAQQIAERLNRKFPDEPSSADSVLNFVHMLYRAGLLLGRDEQHAERLRRMTSERKRKRRLAIAANFLFLKIPLIDPDRPLNAIYSYAGLVMNRATMIVATLAMIISAVAAIAEIHRVGQLQFPILAWQNLLLLSGTFLGVKVIHEFGHGLAAKHRGLEVHEMGILLIVLFPLFYVDVSDAWMVARRRDRLWITAGGVFIEMILAAVAVWLWLGTEPGWLNQTAFNVMLAASVTTLLFNANPLLRYDGYYFLMDWLETPNLRDKSQKFVGYLVKRHVLAMPDERPPLDTDYRPLFMVLFAVASFCYRWLVVFGIIAIIWHVLDPYGLEAVGALLGMLAITTMVLIPLGRLLRFIWKVQARTWRRAAASLAGAAGLAAVAAAILMIPTEQTIEQPSVIMAAERQPIYIPADGEVAKVFVRFGEVVEAGQPLLRLDGEQLEDELAQLRIDRRLEELRQRRSRRGGRQGEVVASARILETIDQRIEQTQAKLDELTIRAPVAGRLHTTRRPQTLLGVHLQQGQELGAVIGEARREVVVILPEADAALVQPGMPARLRLWSMPERTCLGSVHSVGRQFLADLPHEALASVYGGELDTTMTRQRRPRPAQPSVIARVTLDDPPALPLLDGMTGRTKIVIDERRRLGGQLWRQIRTGIALDWWL